MQSSKVQIGSAFDRNAENGGILGDQRRSTYQIEAGFGFSRRIGEDRIQNQMGIL
jgi:hypothetical protein